MHAPGFTPVLLIFLVFRVVSFVLIVFVLFPCPINVVSASALQPFDIEFTWWRLFQKCVVCSNLKYHCIYYIAKYNQAQTTLHNKLPVVVREQVTIALQNTSVFSITTSVIMNDCFHIASVICSVSVAMFRGLCEWPEEYCNGPRLMFVLVTPKLLYSWFIFGACENKEGNHFYSE